MLLPASGLTPAHGLTSWLLGPEDRLRAESTAWYKVALFFFLDRQIWLRLLLDKSARGHYITVQTSVSSSCRLNREGNATSLTIESRGQPPKAPRVAHSLSPAFLEPLGFRSKATGRFPEVHPGHTAKPAALVSRLLGSHASLAETCLPGRGPAPPLSYLPWKPAPALMHLG